MLGQVTLLHGAGAEDHPLDSGPRDPILHPPNAHARPSNDHGNVHGSRLAWLQMWSHYLNDQPCAIADPQRLLSSCFYPQCMASRKQPELHVSDVRLVRNATIRNRATHRRRIKGCNVNHCPPGPLCNGFHLLVLRRHSIPVIMYIALPTRTQLCL
jgi:hypothetical protein